MIRLAYASLALAPLVLVAGCGSTSPVASQHDPADYNDHYVFRTYLNAAIHSDCAAARRLMLPAAQRSTDLCGTASDKDLHIDRWHQGPDEFWASGTVVEGVPIDLHVLSGRGVTKPHWIRVELGLMQVGDLWRIEPGMFPR